MANTFWYLLLGHLVGDYLLQNNWMAQNKKKRGKEIEVGLKACFIHCLLYTLSICLFVGIWKISFFILIFLSHWVFDRYNLVELWANKIGTRIWNNCVDLSQPNKTSFTKEESIHLSFGVFVYIVMDNTFHLLLMTLILNRYI